MVDKTEKQEQSYRPQKDLTLNFQDTTLPQEYQLWTE